MYCGNEYAAEGAGREAFFPATNYLKFLGVTFNIILRSSAQTTHILWIEKSKKVFQAIAATLGSRIRWLAIRFHWFLPECSVERTPRGCLFMTPVKNLHEEAKILPSRRHNRMLSFQYPLECYCGCYIVHRAPTIKKRASRCCQPLQFECFPRTAFIIQMWPKSRKYRKLGRGLGLGTFVSYQIFWWKVWRKS